MWLHIRTFSCSLLLTSGDSTGLSAEGITGRVLLIVTVIIGLLVWALLVTSCAYLICKQGNHLSVHLIHILLCGRTCKTLLSCCFTYVVNYTSLVVTIMELSKPYCSLISRVSCMDGEKEPGTHCLRMLCSSWISGNLGNFCKICSIDGNVVCCWSDRQI